MTIKCVLHDLHHAELVGYDPNAEESYTLTVESIWHYKKYSKSTTSSLTYVYKEEINTIAKCCKGIKIDTIIVYQGLKSKDRCGYDPTTLTSLTLKYLQDLADAMNTNVNIISNSSWGKDRLDGKIMESVTFPITPSSEVEVSEIKSGDTIQVKLGALQSNGRVLAPWITSARTFSVDAVDGDNITISTKNKTITLNKTDIIPTENVDSDDAIDKGSSLITSDKANFISIPVYSTKYASTPITHRIKNLYVISFDTQTSRYQVSDSKNGKPIGWVDHKDILLVGIKYVLGTSGDKDKDKEDKPNDNNGNDNPFGTPDDDKPNDNNGNDNPFGTPDDDNKEDEPNDNPFGTPDDDDDNETDKWDNTNFSKTNTLYNKSTKSN